ncbi:MAG TPA: DUF1674 domain-containing protein [Lysobacter sp.]|nr:DUF1674 domain-containing protein [Lysobacter sp.]
MTPQIIGQSEPPTDADRTPQGPSSTDRETSPTDAPVQDRPVEIGGRKGLDPTRYGDWEKNGRCIDF